MNRRDFLKSAAALSAIQMGCTGFSGSGKRARSRRVRPGDPDWPSAADWERLNTEVGARLVKIEPPLATCHTDPNGADCAELFRRLKNPYYIGDEPGLTQTSGWVDAWTSTPSVFAVAAASTNDVI